MDQPFRRPARRRSTAFAPRLLMSLCLALPLSAWSVETETLP